MKTICIICKERRAICKQKCQRCYYAVKRGSKSRFVLLKEQNFEKYGKYYLGKKFLVDEDDFEKFKGYTWWDNGNGYARNEKLGYLHRIIHPTPEYVDHINRNTLDNRKKNLRNGKYINSLNIGKKFSLPIFQHPSGLWYGRPVIKGIRYYITANKDRKIIKKKVIKMLKKFNRLQFYKEN